MVIHTMPLGQDQGRERSTQHTAGSTQATPTRDTPRENTMTTVTLTKAIGGHSKGDTINVSPGTASYLINTGHAEANEPIETTSKPKAAASKGEWTKYALDNGVSEADLDGLTRDEIRDRIG